MAANIEWADPKVAECWSYAGRLYMSYRKAEIERNSTLKYRQAYLLSGRDAPSWWRDLPPIYRVKWEWEEVDG